MRATGALLYLAGAAGMAGIFAHSARPAEVMPISQQNALVKKYCAVCHTDAADNGGLSLQHFDAAQAPPSLMAMMLSKLTGGVSLESVRLAPSNAGAAALLNKNMKSGAMGAAGIPVPEQSTVDALIRAFGIESSKALEWTVQHRGTGAASASVIEASTLREIPSATNAGEARVYRLKLSCDVRKRTGFMQLAWSPVPAKGILAASIDGKRAAKYRVEGGEKMGNGSSVVSQGLAAIELTASLPAEALTVTELFPGETVVFSFASLPQQARHELQACFREAGESE